MTEAEWLTCVDPEPLLGHLRGTASDRKLRLLACSCARRIWGAAEECRGEKMHPQVVLAEAFAEGCAAPEEVDAARANEWGVGEYSSFACALYAGYATIERDAASAASSAARSAAVGFVMIARESRGWGNSENDRDAVTAVHRAELAHQAALVREIFSNPFRPVTFSPAWRTGTALTLARQMYESREFSAMPILADALQDAGCDSDEVLSHCRGSGPHVRGCWSTRCSARSEHGAPGARVTVSGARPLRYPPLCGPAGRG